MYGPAQERAKARVGDRAALEGAAMSDKFRAGAGETEYLLAKNQEATQAQKEASAKLAAAAEQLSRAAADQLASARGPNRGNAPTVPAPAVR
jgi:hypothetical protein